MNSILLFPESEHMWLHKLCSFMALPGYVTVGGSLDFSQPQIPSLQKKMVEEDLA